MIRYIFKRIGLAFGTAFIILSLTFILIKSLPFEKPIGTDESVFAYYSVEVVNGYVIDSPYATDKYGELLWSHKDSRGVMHYYYETPVMMQYASWLKNIVTRWDWGSSVAIDPNNSAGDIILSRLPITMQLNFIATLISVPIGIALGILAALKKNSKTDHALSTGVMVMISIPSFVIITVLLLVFAYNLDWVPSQWPSSLASLDQRIKAYIIPICALSFGSIAGYTRFVRAELCEVMSSEYLLLARTKGLTKKQAIKRHALKNSMVPVFPAILAEFMGLLMGSVILERLYGIPGIGSLFIEAIDYKDYNVLFVNMAVFTTLGLLFSVLLDLSYGFIDPRIRMGAKK